MGEVTVLIVVLNVLQTDFKIYLLFDSASNITTESYVKSKILDRNNIDYILNF